MANPIDIREIKSHAEVVGSDLQHVGKVDHVAEDNQLKLVKNDSQAGNTHHLIPTDWIESIDSGQVILNKTAAEVQKHWEAV
ncbi:MAG: DUF2171 domain-containing protein [Rickettsiales bacterium]|nr:MAG: DUF2171 domain-containing protein [Rickettsiales bacterium]